MPYDAYKVLHIFSVILTFTVLGGLALHATNGGGREGNAAGKLPGILHGLGLLLVLISGFGLLARLDLGGIPPWVWCKLVIWLAIGASAAVVRRSPTLSRVLFFLLPLLGGIAVWLAIYKPFS
jgi:hypothetical protein